MRAANGTIATKVLGATVTVALFLAACGPTSPRGPDSVARSGDTATSRPTTLKSITMASTVERPLLLAQLQRQPGFGRWYWLANAYLTALDHTETPQPILAEEIPSVQQRTWTTRSDGTMETIYKIRPSARWHDGKPVVAKDFVLAWEVYLDPEFPARDITIEKLISAIETPDERTLQIRWRATYIGANAVGAGSLEPLPSHLLEHLYRTDKASFIDGKHWSTDFIGAGPFRVERWSVSEGQFVLGAHDGFALGRPKIDQIHIRVIEDENAVLAGILAGAVDAMTDSFGTETALILREQWESKGLGKVGVSPGALRYLTLQLRDILGTQPLHDSRVRKALSFAIDREGLAKVQPPGFTPPAYYAMSLSDRLYQTVESSVPKNANEPAASERLLDEAGYPRGLDGLRRSRTGERLAVPILTSPGSEDELIATVLGDNWSRLGLESPFSMIPPSRASDRELQATFPGVVMKSSFPRFDQFQFTSDKIPHEGNRWTGSNLSGYKSFETDSLAAAILTTLDVSERDRLIIQLLRLWAEDIPIIPFLFKSRFIAVAKGISGYDVKVSSVQGATAWSIYNWRKD